jgi:hypothetical protein
MPFAGDTTTFYNIDQWMRGLEAKVVQATPMSRCPVVNIIASDLQPILNLSHTSVCSEQGIKYPR